ncbi:MAG: hypothetical protein ACKOW8_05605, partial [Flavobacteriales bacterium]
IIIITATLFDGCTPKMIYAKYGKYKLEECERNIYPISGDWLPKFEQHCYHEGNEIFLNRVVHCTNDSTTLFISVSETILQNDLQRLLRDDNTARLLDSKSLVLRNQRVDCSLFVKGNGFVMRSVYVEKKSALLVVMDWVFLNIEQAQKHYDEADKIMDSKINL